MADDPMWCIAMFDLPVQTKKQRGEATRFRNLLLDEGFWRVQYSVYVRYAPTVAGETRRIKTVKSNLPDGGEVRIVYVTDREWSQGLRFVNEVSTKPDSEPQQLLIF